MIMKKTLIVLVTAIAITTMSACTEVLQQVQQAAQLAKCDFRLKDVKNLSLAGVNVQSIDSWSSIGLVDIAKITAAFTQGSLPVNFILNTEIRNPNAIAASLTKLDYMILVDQTQIATGSTNQRIDVPANGGVSVIPLSINTDLKKLFSGESLTSLSNLVLGMSDASGKPTKLTLKAKPYINVGGTSVAYPGYINIKTDFVNQ